MYDQIIAIVRPDQISAVIHTARSAGAMSGAAFRAEGTVSSEIMNMLGLANREKAMVIMLSRSGVTELVLSALAGHFEMHKAAHGIAYCVPILACKGINALYRLQDQYLGTPEILKNTAREAAPQKGETTLQFEHEVLHIIVKSGFAEEAMDAARSAGAEGGTIIHARGVGVHESVKLFGVAIEPEKDVLVIIVKKEISEAVMKAVAEHVGLNMPAHGIAFAMPVTRVMGVAHAGRNA